MTSIATIAVLTLLVAHLGWQAWRANFRFFVDYRNPYVYAHPLSGVVQVGAWVEKLAAVHPDGRALLVQVGAEDPWPLPWYLRRLTRVGYWESLPPPAGAPIIILSTTLPAPPPGFCPDCQVSTYGLRPDVQLSVYVQRELYEAFAARAGG